VGGEREGKERREECIWSGGIKLRKRNA